jgi:hypothetical protein
MKKALTLVFVFLIIPSLKLLAQESSLTLNTKSETFWELSYLAKKDGFYLVIANLNTKNFQFTKLNSTDMTIAFQKEFKLPMANGERVEFKNALYFHGRTCLFTTSYSNAKKNRFYNLYLTEINDNGEIISSPKLIDSLSWNTKCSSTGFRQVLSSDSSKLLLYHKLDECDDKTVPGRYSFTILDDKLNSVFTKNLELPKGFSKYDLSKFMMDKEDNIYFIEKEYEKDSYIDGDLFKISVNCYKTKEQKLIRNPIDIGESRFLNLEIQLTKKEDVIVSGAYAIDKDFGSNWQNISCMKGVFCGLIDHVTGITKVLYKKDMDELLSGERKVHTAGASLMVDDGKHLYRTNLDHTGVFDDNKAVLFFAFNKTVGSVHFTGSVVGMFFDFTDEKQNSLRAFPKVESNNNTPNTVETLKDIMLVRNNRIYLLYNFNRQLEISSNGEHADKQLYEITKENKSYLLSQKTMYMVNPNELFILATNDVTTPSNVSYRPVKLNFKN